LTAISRDGEHPVFGPRPQGDLPELWAPERSKWGDRSGADRVIAILPNIQFLAPCSGDHRSPSHRA